jgi:uncharacterized DUF497 family protein
MRIEFDTFKNDKNIRERGLSFELVAGFDFAAARIWQDTRKAYSEARFIAMGYLNNRLHVLCFAQMDGGVRVISFRKANAREGAQHGFTLTCD